MPTEPAPIFVASSGKFLGDDGAWSTFAVDVGTPPQTLQLLASTSQSATWAVSLNGCEGKDDATNCTDARGGLFDSSKSSTWFRKDIYQLNEAMNLGYRGNEYNGTYGFDTMALSGPSGSPRISLDHQVIAGLAVSKGFYLGSIGLAPQTVNFSNSGDSSPSFISSLKEQNLIPSLSYGYTAGAFYKNQAGDASLILGGYDSSKFKPNDMQLDFAGNPQRPLVTGLKGVTYTDSKGDKRMLKEGILAFIDSTVPYIWLPESACNAFEDTFGLQWDGTKALYFVNDTAHKDLIKANPTLTFALANTDSKGATVNITFPYAAFDLNVTQPIVPKTRRYFPLQRAPDENSYTLGRTFLQEAYIITNYETSTFSISQAVHDDTPSHVVTIPSNSNRTSGSNTTGGASKSTKSGGIGTGAIAGVAIAIAVVGIIVAIVAFVCMRRRRRARRAALVHQTHLPPAEMTKTVLSTTRNSSDDPEPKKLAGPSVHVEQTDAPITPPLEMDADHVFGPGPSQAPMELPGDRMSRTELSTPEPVVSRELESPDFAAAIRSELSTPEPILPQQELPTPDPSHELPSPNLIAADRRSPKPRPQSYRMDSSGSESGFTRDGMATFGHRRHGSVDSPRPQARRLDTEDSLESPILGRLSTNIADIDSSIFSFPASTVSIATTGRSLPQVAKRPVHLRQDSDTWQTRLDMTSDESAPSSRFGTVKENERKESEASVAGTVNSLVESPVIRKPVPIRASMDESKPPFDENDEKDEKAKQ